jgi:hypothetical protein
VFHKLVRRCQWFRRYPGLDRTLRHVDDSQFARQLAAVALAHVNASDRRNLLAVGTLLRVMMRDDGTFSDGASTSGEGSSNSSVLQWRSDYRYHVAGIVEPKPERMLVLVDYEQTERLAKAVEARAGYSQPDVTVFMDSRFFIRIELCHAAHWVFLNIEADCNYFVQTSTVHFTDVCITEVGVTNKPVPRHAYWR